MVLIFEMLLYESWKIECLNEYGVFCISRFYDLFSRIESFREYWFMRENQYSLSSIIKNSVWISSSSECISSLSLFFLLLSVLSSCISGRSRNIRNTSRSSWESISYQSSLSHFSELTRSIQTIRLRKKIASPSNKLISNIQKYASRNRRPPECR